MLSSLPRAPARVIDADIATASGAADKVVHLESVPPYLRRTEAARILLLAGESRFGAPDSAARAAVKSIQDVQRLEDLITRTQTAASWEELLEQSPSRRRNGCRRPQA
jgi:hypothetical protein